MDDAKPFAFICFGDIDGLKPYGFAVKRRLFDSHAFSTTRAWSTNPQTSLRELGLYVSPAKLGIDKRLDRPRSKSLFICTFDQFRDCRFQCDVASAPSPDLQRSGRFALLWEAGCPSNGGWVTCTSDLRAGFPDLVLGGFGAVRPV